MRTIHFIVNRLSGNAFAIKDQIYRHFKGSEYTVVLKYSSYRKHTVELTRNSIKEGAEVIVACGGDGTVNEVAQCLVNTQIPLGIIPIGSGNGLARHLGIPTKPALAFRILADLKSKKIDVGEANEKYFFCNISVAFSAQLIHCYDALHQRGFLGYTRAFLKAIASYTYHTFEVEIGEEVLHSTPFLLLLSNTDQLGYNKTLTPDASLFDGKLDMIRVERSSFLSLSVFLLFAFFRKFPAVANVNRIQLEEAALKFGGGPLKIQMDGEKLHCHTGRLHVRVLPKALNVICPQLS